MKPFQPSNLFEDTFRKIFLSIAHFARNVVYIFSEYHIKSCIDRIQIEYALIYNTHF